MLSKSSVNEKLRTILLFKTDGHVTQAIRDLGTLVELVLKSLYVDLWKDLTPIQKEKLVKVEIKRGKNKPPIKSYTLGNWIYYFQETELITLLSKIRDIPIDFLNLDKMEELRKLRNKCTHEDYECPLEDFSTTYDFVVKFLVDIKYIDKGPIEISKRIEREVSKAVLETWVDRVRLVLSAEPIFEKFDVIDEGNGKYYDYNCKWEVIGCISKFENIIVYVYQHDESFYHEDVMEEVPEIMARLILNKIKAKIPEISNKNFTFEISESIPSIGDYEVDLTLE